jgi:hypothetical protein
MKQRRLVAFASIMVTGGVVGAACGSRGTSAPRQQGDTPLDAAPADATAGSTGVAAHDAEVVTPEEPYDAKVVPPEEPYDADVAETGPQTCGFAPCAPGQPCPDLIGDPEDLVASITISTRNFAPTDCAILEGCILQTGTRRLLRFDTATQNVGSADLVIGDPSMNACFVWSECHQHFHFKGVGAYTLDEADGVTVAAVGHKQGFCMDDVEAIPTLTPPPANPATPFSCTNQGLHKGWEDVYPADIDCQWVDITGVPPGQYVLSVVINGEHLMPESNYANNETRTPVTIPPP